MSYENGQEHIHAQEYKLSYYYNNFRGHLEKKFKTVNTPGFDSVFIQVWKSALNTQKTWQKMTTKLLKTIFALNLSSNWNYKIYRYKEMAF